MVTYVRDQTGRFPRRPHYAPDELDRECESIITTFLKGLRGEVRYPVETEALKTLIERDADDLDTYADLSGYGRDVEGVTEFRPGGKPVVKISAELAGDTRRKNRLRTTLTHEYGHVRFHGYLFEENPPQPDLLQQQPNRDKIICKRDSMIDAAQSDWMEWQAGYICGALLMPKSAVVRIYQEFSKQHGLYNAVSLQTPHGGALVERIAEAFQVSSEAARVRLLKLRVVTPGPANRSLFD
jgi:hypothetical protein